MAVENKIQVREILEKSVSAIIEGTNEDEISEASEENLDLALASQIDGSIILAEDQMINLDILKTYMQRLGVNDLTSVCEDG